MGFDAVGMCDPCEVEGGSLFALRRREKKATSAPTVHDVCAAAIGVRYVKFSWRTSRDAQEHEDCEYGEQPCYSQTFLKHNLYTHKAEQPLVYRMEQQFSLTNGHTSSAR